MEAQEEHTQGKHPPQQDSNSSPALILAQVVAALGTHVTLQVGVTCLPQLWGPPLPLAVPFQTIQRDCSLGQVRDNSF